MFNKTTNTILITMFIFQSTIIPFNVKNTTDASISSETDIQNQKFKDYGFTGELIDWVSNDRDYEWYEDQYRTGIYCYNNCGASVATMAIKYTDKSFNNTGEDARNTYQTDGSWWSTNTVFQYLADNHVFTYIKPYDYTEEEIEEVINKQRLIILCINTYYIQAVTSSSSVIVRFYYGSIGHFIIIKGYVKTTNNFYLEVYDPYSMGQTYANSILKGKVRYYTLTDINNAVKNRWENMIVAGVY